MSECDVCGDDSSSKDIRIKGPNDRFVQTWTLCEDPDCLVSLGVKKAVCDKPSIDDEAKKTALEERLEQLGSFP